jgi:hypothetical protein
MDPEKFPMRHPRLSLTILACALLVAAAVPSAAQQGKGAPAKGAEQAPALAPPKPYKPVAIELVPPVNDPTFDAFRKQLGEIAKRKDKSGLAKLVAANFFWQTDSGDKADKKKAPGDNLAAALGLGTSEGAGWDLLGERAEDPNASPTLQRKSAICSPAEPKLEPKDLDALAKATGTEPFEWAFPAQAGVEVRGAAQPNAPVFEKLGLHLVRIVLDDQPDGQQDVPMIKVVTPSGKVGFVSGDAISPMGSDQICYIKEANGWKIAGIIGGEQQ